MKEICCLDCEHCHDYLQFEDGGALVYFCYTCDAGSVVKDIEDPEKVIDCPDFVQFVDDI